LGHTSASVVTTPCIRNSARNSFTLNRFSHASSGSLGIDDDAVDVDDDEEEDEDAPLAG
jgi:hypothetical protein